MSEKERKAISIVKTFPKDEQTLEKYDLFMTMSNKTLDMCMDDLGLNADEIIPQLDLTMELDLLKPNTERR